MMFRALQVGRPRSISNQVDLFAVGVILNTYKAIDSLGQLSPIACGLSLEGKKDIIC